MSFNLFVTRMTLMFRFLLGDSHMLQSVCGKGNYNEDDIDVMKDLNLNVDKNLEISFLMFYVGILRDVTQQLILL